MKSRRSPTEEKRKTAMILSTELSGRDGIQSMIHGRVRHPFARVVLMH